MPERAAILVVEDSRTQAERLRFLLEEAGYAVRVAGGGEEALAALDAARPDLVITDIVMPGMDGYALCRAIKARAGAPALPVLLLTSLSDPEDVLRGLECGADGFATKPYDEAMLLSRIAFTLENRDAGTDAGTGEMAILQAGTPRRIASGRFPILNFLLSTYETALHKHAELEVARDQLSALNADLELRVQERTATLRAEMRVRQQAESSLRESEDRLRDLFDNVHDLIQVTDADGGLVFVNRAWREKLEYEDADLAGLAFTDLAPPAERESFRAAFHALAEGGKGGRLQAELLSRTGRPLTVEGHLSCRMSGGEVVGTRAILRDVTAERRLEEQYRQSQKIEAVGRLAGGIAHDFNNLLTAINGFSELLLARLPDGDPSREYAEEIRRSGERAAALTRQLLAYSRKQVLKPSRLDLNGALEGTARMLRRLLGEAVDLRLEIDPSAPPVQADPNQLEQVILNLAVNARDAMPGGGTLTLRTGIAQVEEPPEGPEGPPAGTYALLTVADTGEGMTGEVRERMFEPFFTTKAPGKGTGLGLSMVQGIIRQSGGFIRLDSEPGRGTTFRIHLPALTEEADAPAEPGAEAGEELRGSETLLLVEDEENVRGFLRSLLEGHGYRVLEAGNGAEALEVAAGHDGGIDLLLSDVVMARMGGPELWERFRADRPGTAALFMSGYSEETVRRQGSFPDGATFIQKPFSSAEILRRVRLALAHAGTRPSR